MFDPDQHRQQHRQHHAKRQDDGWYLLLANWIRGSPLLPALKCDHKTGKNRSKRFHDILGYGSVQSQLHTVLLKPRTFKRWVGPITSFRNNIPNTVVSFADVIKTEVDICCFQCWEWESVIVDRSCSKTNESDLCINLHHSFYGTSQSR